MRAVISLGLQISPTGSKEMYRYLGIVAFFVSTYHWGSLSDMFLEASMLCL
ncbi:hypothetical protein BofuT4_uP075240.1 [Botrytis cinerea T4]|uniref:Uncharacterized protein n=1 Tax=Botryotinia fuckeliana (strain T4) TaxID=999810 RepID=G2XNI5_BOTF4|nr:hypothetical protein BofuT4_uP075240.1 [Botrytis cinerea T4]